MRYICPIRVYEFIYTVNNMYDDFVILQYCFFLREFFFFVLRFFIWNLVLLTSYSNLPQFPVVRPHYQTVGQPARDLTGSNLKFMAELNHGCKQTNSLLTV